jgi:guanylate kinase
MELSGPVTIMGPLIIISGPAGSGKTTVVSRLLETTRFPLRRAITATTREPRLGEVDGRDYHFWSKERVERELMAGQFLEHAVVHGGDYYGTPRSEVEPYRQRGQGVILVIDVQGAALVRQVHPEAYSIFMRVPGDRYEVRLNARGDDAAAIERRMRSARLELMRVDEYDDQLINDCLDDTVRQLEQRIAQLYTCVEG